MKVVDNSISYKKLSGRTCLSPSGARGLKRLPYFKYNALKWDRSFYFRAHRCQNY